jgi:hypothetical protein
MDDKLPWLLQSLAVERWDNTAVRTYMSETASPALMGRTAES